MSSIINSVELENWFNYKGIQQISFSENANIIVGTNNAGKTKLFNAFKYIIHGSIILNVMEDDLRVSQSVLLKNHLWDVYNKASFSELNVGDKGYLGVKLKFTKTKKRDDSKETWILQKRISFRKKDDFSIEEIEESENVYFFDSRTGSERKRSESFNDILHKLIPSLYSPFFLIEGEQMGMMTPLSGNGLKRTVNSLTSISNIDELVNTFLKLNKWSKSELKRQIDNDSKSSYEQKRLEETGEKLENQIEEQSQLLAELNENITRLKKSAEEKEESAKKSEFANKRLIELKGIQTKIIEAEKAIDNSHRKFLDDLTNPEFLLSHLEDDSNTKPKIKIFLESVAGFTNARLTELNDQINKEERRLLQKFVHDQPQPQLLEDMLSEGKCFVCTSELTDKAKEFMIKKLIPHLSGKQDSDDKEFQFLNLVHNSLVEITNAGQTYFTAREGVLNDRLVQHSELRSQKVQLEDALADFQEKYGDETNLELDGSGNILKNYANVMKELGSLEKSLEDAKKRKKDLEISLRGNEIEKSKLRELEGEDEKSKSLRNMSNFFEDISTELSQIKDNIYQDFAKTLEEKASSRFQSLMEYNRTIEEQKLTVEITKNEYSQDYSFSIQLIDRHGNKMNQTGGASSTLEPLSAILGLIDMSENRTKAPFIADAPVSRMADASKESFLKTIIQDNVLGQTIVTLMDLWDDRTDTLTELGEKIKNLIQSRENSSMMILEPLKDNTGVNINYVIDGK